ncbi:MAG TPA: cupredoxin domain-containing protein [Gaiellaceae bacterium]
MKKLFVPFIAVAALAVGAAPAAPATTATVQINIKASSFAPSVKTIKTGDSVKWVNVDTKNHQVVSNNGSFVSPILGPGKTYSHQFRAAGTYRYHDGLNPTVRGTIKVSGPAPAVTAGVSLPIIVYGQGVSLSGTVSSGQANEKVTIYQQPYPQTSFAEMTTVLTTAGGAWNLVLSPSPKIFTNYQAKWNGRASVTVGVSVRPRIRLFYRNGRFTTAVQSATSHARRSVQAQRLSRFGQWVTLKKVRLGGKSSAIFRLSLPKGKSRIRIAMSVNQAGAGYLAGYSPTITVRRR